MERPVGRTKLYQVWCMMKNRCQCPTSKYYKNYGGRGIKVCSEWQSYEPFYEWAMSHGYKEGLSLDRIDNNNGYQPNNCRWADKVTQENNRRDNRFFEYKGERHTIAEWARIVGIDVRTLGYRFRKGWSVEDALTTKPWFGNCKKRGRA